MHAFSQKTCSNISLESFVYSLVSHYTCVTLCISCHLSIFAIQSLTIMIPDDSSTVREILVS